MRRGAACAAAAAPAQAQYPTPTPAPPAAPNPCVGELAAELLCPDLLMGPPSQMFVSKGGGKVLLHAANDIRSRGEGPLEVRGTRTSRRYMSVRQAIHGRDKKVRLFDTPARLVFYDIPGQGPYWKFQNAAVFQIWSVGANGQRGELLRKGPKLSYCFRDLKRTDPGGAQPGEARLPRVQPAGRDQGADPRDLGRLVGHLPVELLPELDQRPGPSRLLRVRDDRRPAEPPVRERRGQQRGLDTRTAAGVAEGQGQELLRPAAAHEMSRSTAFSIFSRSAYSLGSVSAAMRFRPDEMVVPPS